MEIINSRIKLDTILVGNIAGKFHVPSYQRGYRWGVDEVTRLLDDIYDNGAKSYCLQPIVVKEDNGKYELIDGQQRLTTLFILLQYIKREANIPISSTYQLSYDRDKSEEYLSDIREDIAEENIDFFHMYQAYKTIDEWFEKCKNKVVAAFDIYSFLSKYVKIIWYEIPTDSKDAINLFTRLNIGKIPLTSAELVKAMFLTETNLDVNGKNAELKQKLREAKQNEISTQWDIIEKELHDESLWKFLTNTGGEKYKTRIDLVLDLISEKPDSSREKYYTFFYFDSLRKQGKELSKVWQEIQHTFLLLKDWYEDHDLYHKIGYLIASEYKGGTLADIFKLSKGKTKTQFKEELDALIRESVKISDNYADLEYTKAQDRERITRLLLLFNVESVYKIDGRTQRFPFHQYKSFTSGKIVWSLEHIHAQNSDGLKTEKQWQLWLEKHIDSVKAVAKDKIELIEEVQQAIDKPKLTGDEFKAIHQKITDTLTEKGELSMHSIANLALLNTADNAALNNATFDVKRNEIIRMDKAGQYIPFCTKMVFLKYYTPSESNQLHFWGIEDRIAYVENINRVLNKYLDQKIYTDDKTKSIETEGDEQ